LALHFTQLYGLNCTARSALKDFADNGSPDEWNYILGVGTENNLLTTQVINAFGDEATAREKARDIFADLGETYYSTEPDQLRATLEDFKDAHKDDFQALFGDDITLDEFYGLLYDAREALPGVITVSEAGQLATDTNDDLLDKMPGYLKRAMDEALLQPENQTFSGRLSAIGWSSAKLIAQQEKLAEYIDAQGKARISLALAVVRSETVLEAGPTTLQVGSSYTAVDEYTIKIMGRNATDLVAWASADPSVVNIGEDPDTGNFVIEAVAPGETQLIVYRDYTGADPDYDWLYKIDVMVEGTGVIYGDVNGDGEITIMDAVMILKHITDGTTLTGNQLIAAEVDGESDITIADAVHVLKRITDSTHVFPIEL